MTTKKEVWRDIPGFEGLYQVSDRGEVRSFSRGKHGGLLHKAQDRYGYQRVTLCKNKVHKYCTIHRLVAMAFLGINNALFVNHKDGIKSNNTLSNLEYVTPAENARHALANGLLDIGEQCGSAKLTNEQVREIKRLLLTGELLSSEIAKKFHVTHRNINAIRSGQTWKHISPLP